MTRRTTWGDKHDMAIEDGALIEITMHMQSSGQRVFNVFQYQVAGMLVPASAPEIGQGWWNHVKAAYRAATVTSATNTFTAVAVRELNDPVGAFGEYPVPPGEQQGTRSSGGVNDDNPTFVAAGVRLAVATRLTRPGQKRFPFTNAADSLGSGWTPTFLTLLNAWAAVISSEMVLGVPVAGVNLVPIVCRKDINGDVIAHQPVVGYVTNTNVTSQVSRKIGRGI